MDATRFTELMQVAFRDENVSLALQKALEPLMNKKFKAFTDKIEKQDKTIKKLEQTIEELKKCIVGKKVGVPTAAVSGTEVKGQDPVKKTKKKKTPKKEIQSLPEEFKVQGDLSQFEWVFFDLETTSLERNSDITQIACVCGENSFAQYILPTKPIARRAAEITKLTVKDGKLFHLNEEVQTVEATTALHGFIVFLQNLKKKSLLIAHNARAFDCRVLLHALKEHGLYDLFEQTVAGFVDTLPLMRRVRPSLDKYTQEFLVKAILEKDFNAHDATADVATLQELLQKVNPDEEDVRAYTFTCNYVNNAMRLLEAKRQNKKTLFPLLSSGTITHYMADKIAAAGLQFDNLRDAFATSGPDGIEAIMSEELPGKPIVTKSSKIIVAIGDYFQGNPNPL